MQQNSLYAEQESSLDSWHDYNRGSFLGEKVRCVTLHNFGASVYCDVSKESRKKLYLKIELGVFVGYT